MPDQTTARKLESTLQTALFAGLGHRAIYRAGEQGERLLPCVVIKCEEKGDDMSMRISGRYAKTIELRATAMVSSAGDAAASSLAVEAAAALLRQAIETATITGGWNYLRLDYSGDERAADGIKREYTHIYTVTAHET